MKKKKNKVKSNKSGSSSYRKTPVEDKKLSIHSPRLSSYSSHNSLLNAKLGEKSNTSKKSLSAERIKSNSSV